MNIKGSKKKNQVLSVNIFEQQEIIAKAEAIKAELRELSKSAFGFSNTAEGFESMLDWRTKLAAANDKKQIVLGLEPTGHYWFCLTTWLVAKEISVVQVNPYAVNQTKEVEDNSQLKDDNI